MGVRVGHLLVAGLMLIALVTGLEAFDFSSPPHVLSRDGLFAVHRGAGLMVAMLVVVWLWLRRDHFRRSWVGLWHALLLSIALLIPLAPWLARMLEGRIEEAFALVPLYNLVSQPENSLSYLLLRWHRMLVLGFLALLGVHVAAALLHAIVLKDKTLSRMFSWRTRP